MIKHENTRRVRVTSTSFFTLMTICIIVSGCTRRSNPAINESRAVPAEIKRDKQAVAGNFSSQRVLTFDSVQLNAFLDNYPKFENYAANLHQFYRKRGYTYAWYDENGLIEQAGSLFNRTTHLRLDGITVSLPYA